MFLILILLSLVVHEQEGMVEAEEETKVKVERTEEETKAKVERNGGQE